MKNFAMIFTINDEKSRDEFMNSFAGHYPEYATDMVNNIIFYAFGGKNLPEVVDTLHGILQHLNIEQNDYVSLYYQKDNHPDEIKMQMVQGSASLAEGHTNKISDTVFEETLRNLFKINFAQERSRIHTEKQRK